MEEKGWFNLFKTPLPTPPEDLTLSKLFGTKAAGSLTSHHQHLAEETIQRADFGLKSSAGLSCKSKLLCNAMNEKGQEQFAWRLGGRAKSQAWLELLPKGTACLSQKFLRAGRHLRAHSTVQVFTNPTSFLIHQPAPCCSAAVAAGWCNSADRWLPACFRQALDLCLQESPFFLSCITEWKQPCSSRCWYPLAVLLPGSFGPSRSCFHMGKIPNFKWVRSCYKVSWSRGGYGFL